MVINFEMMNDIFFSYLSDKGSKNELEKAKEIRSQIRESIDWLSYMLTRLDKASDYEELQKEIKEAINQYNSINKKIEKAELSLG